MASSSVPSLLSRVHSLKASLPAPSAPASELNSWTSSQSNSPVLRRHDFNTAIIDIKSSLNTFKTIVWDEEFSNTESEAVRGRAAGRMRDWSSKSEPLLTPLATISALASSSPTTATSPPFSSIPYPFALDINLSPGSLIESAAKSVGVDTFREMALDTSALSGLTTRGDTDTLTIAGKRGVIDIALAQAEEGDWVLKSVSFSFDLGGATIVNSLGQDGEITSAEIEVETLESLVQFLSPPIKNFLKLTTKRVMNFASAGAASSTNIAIQPEDDVENEDTIELLQARALEEFKGRLREIIWFEDMLIPEETSGATGRNIFGEMRSLRSWMDHSENEKNKNAPPAHLYPSVSLEASSSIPSSSSSSTLTHSFLHIIPTQSSPPPLPAHLINLNAAMTVEETSDNFFSWEGVFEPPLVVRVPSNGKGKEREWESLVCPTAKSFKCEWQPFVAGYTRQCWSAPLQVGKPVVISRIGFRSKEEIKNVVKWAKEHVFVAKFFADIFGSQRAEGSTATSAVNHESSSLDGEVDLDELQNRLLSAPSHLPILLSILPSAATSTSTVALDIAIPLPWISITYSSVMGLVTIALRSTSATANTPFLLSQDRLELAWKTIVDSGGGGKELITWFEKLINNSKGSDGHDMEVDA